jgi:hypothetical protein
MADSTIKIPVHPAISRLTGDKTPREPAIRFGGYVGAGTQPGQVRIYSDLNDLSHYLEFDEASVVHTTEAAETEFQGKGTWIWVRANSPVRWVREFQTASNAYGHLRTQVLAQARGSLTQQ